MRFLQNGKHVYIDSIEATSLPVVRVFGWWDSLEAPKMTLRTAQGESVPPLNCYRTWREDVSKSHGSTLDFSGFVIDFLVPSAKCLEIGTHEIEIPNAEQVGTLKPLPYSNLLDGDKVLHREDIYSYGPPTDMNPEMLKLCDQIDGRILDFGAGNGFLVRYLREQGKQAFGIELESERVHGKMVPGVEEYMTMYDGTFPMPYADQSFDYVIATEVFEHIHQLDGTLKECNRIARQGLLVTVPDMSSIPPGWLNHVVPWHVLESTHVNFFNFKSLTKLVSPYFFPERWFRTGNVSINGLLLPGSIGGLFKKHPPASVS